MKVRYSEWNEDLARKIREFRSLFALYQHLLLQTNGDPEEALRWMRELQRQGYLDEDVDLDAFEKSLSEQGLTEGSGAGTVLSKRGERSIREESLALVFSSLRKGTPGQHPTPDEGRGTDTTFETRPYAFGDPVDDLDYTTSLENALRRAGIDAFTLSENDLVVFEREAQASCATVLLLDVSHSMILYGEDRITPAKRVALALAELITTRFPKDSLDVVLFGDEARRVPVDQLPYVGAGPFHTNTKAGLRLAQQILLKLKHSHKQIFIITDGKP